MVRLPLFSISLIFFFIFSCAYANEGPSTPSSDITSWIDLNRIDVNAKHSINYPSSQFDDFDTLTVAMSWNVPFNQQNNLTVEIGDCFDSPDLSVVAYVYIKMETFTVGQNDNNTILPCLNGLNGMPDSWICGDGNTFELALSMNCGDNIFPLVIPNTLPDGEGKNIYFTFKVDRPGRWENEITPSPTAVISAPVSSPQTGQTYPPTTPSSMNDYQASFQLVEENKMAIFKFPLFKEFDVTYSLEKHASVLAGKDSCVDVPFDTDPRLMYYTRTVQDSKKEVSALSCYENDLIFTEYGIIRNGFTCMNELEAFIINCDRFDSNLPIIVRNSEDDKIWNIHFTTTPPKEGKNGGNSNSLNLIAFIVVIVIAALVAFGLVGFTIVVYIFCLRKKNQSQYQQNKTSGENKNKQDIMKQEEGVTRMV